MDQAQLLISPEEYNAWHLGRVIEDTAPAGETEAEATMRSAVIIEMFKCYAPRDAVESVIACHCVSLFFVSQAALRDANAAGLDPKTAKGFRASAVSLSRTMNIWVTKLQLMHQRDDAAARATAKPPPPSPQAAAKPPARPSQRPPPEPFAPEPYAPETQGAPRPVVDPPNGIKPRVSPG